MNQSSQSLGQRFSYALAGERFFAIDFFTLRGDRECESVVVI